MKTMESRIGPKTSIIFIHGIYHGSWCWEKFTKYFEDIGYHTDVVTLFGAPNGHGKVTLNSYLDIVERTAEAAKQAYRGPVILVGHSKGGGLAQCFVARRPGKVDGVVLVSALPLRRMGQFVLSSLWRNISSFRTARETIALLQVAFTLARSKPVSADTLRRSALFSSRISQAEAERYAAMLAPEPFRPFLELVKFAFSPIRVDVPVHAVASTGDRIFSPYEQKVFVGAYGGQTIVVRDLCHDMMLDPGWERAAEATATLVGRIERQLQDGINS